MNTWGHRSQWATAMVVNEFSFMGYHLQKVDIHLSPFLVGHHSPLHRDLDMYQPRPSLPFGEQGNGHASGVPGWLHRGC